MEVRHYTTTTCKQKKLTFTLDLEHFFFDALDVMIEKKMTEMKIV